MDSETQTNENAAITNKKSLNLYSYKKKWWKDWMSARCNITLYHLKLKLTRKTNNLGSENGEKLN